MNKRQLHIGVLLIGCGHHSGAWLMEDSSVELIGDIAYYQSLAQLAERGYFDAVFFADNQALQVSGNDDMPSFWYDPLINLTAISQVTKHVGLVATISSSFANPFTAARQLLSLEHITNGRVGWNLVTSMTDLEAMNHSMTKLPNHSERYGKADEFAQVMNKLMVSWDEEALGYNRATGELIDAQQIKPISHSGKYYHVQGPLTTPQSPQGKPVAMQAGASEQGIALAAKYADAVYSVSWNLTQARNYRQKLDAQLEKMNRHDYIQVFPGLVTYVGDTYEEALAKKTYLDKHMPIEKALKQLSFFVQQDCSTWPLDEPAPELPALNEFEGPIGRYETILAIIEEKQPTVRELLGYISAGGGHLTLIGTPEQIVDEMDHWLNDGVADGFNLMPPTLPGSLEDFVEYIVPELQKRDLYRHNYTTTTLRGHLSLDK